MRALPPVASPERESAAQRLRAAQERFVSAAGDLQRVLSEVEMAIGAASAESRREKAPSDGRLSYRVSEVATLLGVSRDLVEKAVNSGELRAVHMGGVVLIKRVDLEAYLELLS